MSHTPGPWRDDAVTQRQSGLMRGPYPQDMLIVGADQTIVGILYDYLDRTSANARLIAAAPELLAELEYAVRLLAPFGETAQVQRMRQVVAKARGE